MLRRLLVLPALVICLILLTAQGAFAHATVEATSPSDGQTVAAAPHQVSVTFDEPVTLQFGALRVFAPTGARVDEGSPAHPSGHANEITVDLASQLKQGTYTVAWRVVSADSHPVQGAFTFNIGNASTSTVNSSILNPSGSKTVGALYAIARFAAYTAFAVLVGTAVFVVTWWPAGARSTAVRLLLVAAWSGLTAATAGVLALQGPYAAGFGIGRVLDTSMLRATLRTRLGEALSVRLALLALAAGLLAWLFTRLSDATSRARTIASAAGIILAVATASTWAVSGHADTGIQVALAVPVDVVHLCAMAVWLGGLTILAVIVLRRGSPATGSEQARMVRGFSPIALTCVITLVGTGTYQSWRQVGSLPALTDTAYGKLLLLKLLGVALLIGLGYLARAWIARHRDDDNPGITDRTAILRLRRSLACEAGVGMAVLALTAALVNAPPARTAHAAAGGPISASAAFNTGGPGGTGAVQVTVDPARTGADTIHLYTLGPTGKQEQVLQVQASVTLASHSLGPLPVTLHNAGAGHLIGAASLPLAGTWRLAVTVRTDDVDETTVQIPITIR